MKNRNFINACLICGLIFTLFTIANAQSAIGFKSGIRVATKTEAVKADSQRLQLKPFEKYETKDNKEIIHRILSDPKNNLYFGYDLEVSRSSESNKFNVAIKPLSYLPKSTEIADFDKFTARKLPKYPDAMTVGNGDIITLEILQDPQTKTKITDYLKITDDTKPYGVSFSELEPTRDFKMDDVNLKLTGFEVFINGKSVAKMGGGWGPSVYFTVPDRGRIIVSPFPREGYNMQKIGVIIDNKLAFTINGEKYEVVSNSPILGEGGNWSAWILADPNYKKAFDNPKDPNAVEFGSGDLKFFFDKSDFKKLINGLKR